MEGFNRLNCLSAITKEKYIANKILEKNGGNILFCRWYAASQNKTNKCFQKWGKKQSSAKLYLEIFHFSTFFQVILCLKINSFFHHMYFTENTPETLTYKHTYLRTTENHLCPVQQHYQVDPSSWIILKKPYKAYPRLVKWVVIQYISQFWRYSLPFD